MVTQKIEGFGYYRVQDLIISAEMKISKNVGLNGSHFDRTDLEGQNVAPTPVGVTCMLRIQ
jgi:hypothetical protein